MMFYVAVAASSRHRAFIFPSMFVPTFPTFSPSSSRSSSPNPNTNANFQHSSSSRLSNSSFSSSSFSHNGQIALALPPAGAVLLDLGSTPVLLTLGLLVSYLLDLLRLQSVAFFSIWTSRILSQFTFFFTSSFSLSSLRLTLLSLLLATQTTFLISIWISLQFKWLQIENLVIVKTISPIRQSSSPSPTFSPPPRPQSFFSWNSRGRAYGRRNLGEEFRVRIFKN